MSCKSSEKSVASSVVAGDSSTSSLYATLEEEDTDRPGDHTATPDVNISLDKTNEGESDGIPSLVEDLNVKPRPRLPPSPSRPVPVYSGSHNASLPLGRGITRRSIVKNQENNGTNNTSRSAESLGVSFDKIYIRHYSMDISDHPLCSIGAPVGLSWDYEEGTPMDVDVYEFDRRPRRQIRYMVLNFYRRCDILKSLGYTEKDIKEADNERAKVKLQRDSTRILLPIAKLEEAWQSAGRKVKRVLCRSNQGVDEAATKSGGTNRYN